MNQIESLVNRRLWGRSKRVIQSSVDPLRRSGELPFSLHALKPAWSSSLAKKLRFIAFDEKWGFVTIVITKNHVLRARTNPEYDASGA